MKINFCKERNSDIVYSLEDIAKFEVDDSRLSNLICPNCNCSLTYYPAGIKKAYLKTRNGAKHIQTCEYYFNSINKELLIHSDGVIRYKMNTKEKRERALQARKKLFEDKETEKIKSLYARKKRNSPRKTSDTLEATRVKIQLVRDESLAEPNINETMLKGRIRIPRKLVSDINENAVGKTLNVIGFLSEIKFLEKEVILILQHKELYFKVFLTESFFAKVSKNYLDYLKIINDCILDNSLLIDVVVSGDLILDSEGLYLAVYEDDDLYFMGMRTVQFAVNIIKKEGV